MTARNSIILDFDGTVALGRGPLQAYAHAVGTRLDEAGARACLAAIDEFDTGTSPYRDAYDAVRSAALARGLDDDSLSQAYRDSRELLGTEAAEVHAPSGLPDFLDSIADLADRILVTNAPVTGLHRTLDSLGIAGRLDGIHTDAGKPAGLVPIITPYLARGPVLCIGDIWEFDLAPAAELGAGTALVGVRDAPEAQPMMRGASLSDLYEPVRDWLRAH